MLKVVTFVMIFEFPAHHLNFSAIYESISKASNKKINNKSYVKNLQD